MIYTVWVMFKSLRRFFIDYYCRDVVYLLARCGDTEAGVCD